MDSDNGSKPKPHPLQAEMLARQLKDSLARRRPRPVLPVLAVLGGSCVILVFLAYWFYPRPQPLPLQILALDAVCTVNEELQVRAQLLTPAGDTTLRKLNGQAIVFHKIVPPNAKDKPLEHVASSDARGQAVAPWPIPTTAAAEFLVNHTDQANQHVQSDRGRIFVWPEDAPLLIVDANETLDAAEVEAEGAAKLKGAAKDGWRVVYLAMTSENPHALRKSRNWILANQAKLPMGPVLGRAHFAEDNSVRHEALRALKKRFTGAMIAIVKNPESAEVSKEVGVTTIQVGPGPAPPGIVHVASWTDVVIPALRADK